MSVTTGTLCVEGTEVSGTNLMGKEESILSLKSIFDMLQKQGCRLAKNPILLPRHYMACFTHRR
jgi:hypothetical protein